MLASHTRERIRRLRLAKAVSQAEFAAALGVSTGTVSKIETGRSDVTSDQLETIAVSLGCTTTFLLRDEEVLPTTRPWLRAYADAPKKVVDCEIASAVTAIEAIESLRLRPLADRLPVTAGDLADDDEIEAMASTVRVAAGLEEDAVCGNSIRAAERLGCLVLPMGEELGRHLGMSMRVDGTPIICASRPTNDAHRRVPGDRQRFTIAHEIGHLALHGNVPAPRNSAEAARLERQAHQFAGAFLAPGDAMIEELHDLGGRVTLKTLSEIKRRWGISIKALVMRFQVLNVIDQDQARSLHKQISARGWSKNEPVETGNEAALWFPKVLAKLAPAGLNPHDYAGLKAGLDPAYFRRWTDWSAALSAEIVELPSSGQASTESGALADVSDLSAARNLRARSTSTRRQ